MAEPENWTPQDVRRMWPQAAGELRGFANHLARGQAGLTAAQIRMAIQLADERFKQLEVEPNTQVQSLLHKWKKRLQPHREEGDPPEEFIVDLMEDFIKDLETL